MKRYLGFGLVLLVFGCTSEIVTHQRLFTPGDKGAMTFKIPSGGLNLIIQPTLLPDADQRAKAQAYPYAFDYVTLGADQQPIARQSVQGLVHCDRARDGESGRALRCPGSRVLIDLKSSSRTPQFLTIIRDPRQKARDLYFSVTMRASQSDYRARLHGLRLAPHEKSALLDTAYAGQQDDVKQLAALSTLAPLGKTNKDYRDQVIYQDGATAASLAPRFPSYAVIGPDARIVVPLYKREVPVRVRALPLGDASDYTVCWQPMAEPLEGRCYKVGHSASPDTSFVFPRGRLIFSAPQPLALDVEYSLTEQQKFHLVDAVQQYNVHRLATGQTLSVNLDPFQTSEYLPLRLHVWTVQSQNGQPPSVLDLKVVMPDGTVRQHERLNLDPRVSTFDRSLSEAEVLSRLNTFYIAAQRGGGRLLIQASSDILVNMTLGRASTPLYAQLQALGMIRTDKDREFWIPIAPEESMPQDKVASYAWNPDIGLVEAQRVFFPIRDLSPGSFAFTPTHVEEMTWESRRRSAHYAPLRPGVATEAVLERGPLLPMLLVAAPGSHAALRANGHTLWEGRLDRNTVLGNLDVSRFLQGTRLQLVAEGAEIFVGGIRLAQTMSTVYGKRFYYQQNRGSFLIQKTSPQQTVNIELLLTEAPATKAEVQVNLDSVPDANALSVSREFTHRQRVYTIMPRPLAADSMLVDGRKAELVTFPLPLRSDLPPGEYQVNVTTSGMNGVFLAVSSQQPNFGIRLTSASERLPLNEATE